MYTFSIKKVFLLSIENKPGKNYIDIIKSNNLNPGGVIKIKAHSKRICEKVRILCWKIKEKEKKLYRS